MSIWKNIKLVSNISLGPVYNHFVLVFLENTKTMIKKLWKQLNFRWFIIMCMQVGIANTNRSIYPVSSFSLRSFLVDGCCTWQNEGTFVNFIRIQQRLFGLVRWIYFILINLKIIFIVLPACQCWLKKQKDILSPDIRASGDQVMWTSGLMFGKTEVLCNSFNLIQCI